MKNFFIKVKRSLSDPTLYRESLAGREVSSKVAYIIGLSLLGALVSTVIFAQILYIDEVPSVRTALESIPSDLVIKVKSGELSINQPVPYVIPLPAKEQDEHFSNILVIDTQAPSSLETAVHYRTVAFVNKTVVIIQESSGRARLFPLSNLPDFTFSREGALGVFGTVVRFSWILLLVVLLFVAMFTFVWAVAALLIAGSLLWMILKIASRPASYRHAFTATMYGFTAVLAVDVVKLILGFSTGGFIESVLIATVVPLLFIFSPKK